MTDQYPEERDTTDPDPAETQPTETSTNEKRRARNKRARRFTSRLGKVARWLPTAYTVGRHIWDEVFGG